MCALVHSISPRRSVLSRGHVSSTRPEQLLRLASHPLPRPEEEDLAREKSKVLRLSKIPPSKAAKKSWAQSRPSPLPHPQSPADSSQKACMTREISVLESYLRSACSGRM